MDIEELEQWVAASLRYLKDTCGSQPWEDAAPGGDNDDRRTEP